MRRKLSSEEKKRLQEMLDAQSMNQTKREQKLLEQKKGLISGMIESSAFHDATPSSARGRGQKLAQRMRNKRANKNPVLKQMKLTEEEKEELGAKIWGDK